MANLRGVTQYLCFLRLETTETEQERRRRLELARSQFVADHLNQHQKAS